MIGDVLASTVICENLKKFYPNCIIDFVANRNTLAVLQENPFIDNIIVFEEKYRKSKYDFLKFVFQFRKKKYDVVIDAYQKLESKLITLFSRAPLKISYKKPFSSLVYNKTIIRETTEAPIPRAIKHRLLLLSYVNIPLQDCVTNAKIYLRKDEISQAKVFLEKNNVSLEKPLIMMSIVGSNKSKTYPHEYMAKVVDVITSQLDATILFNYMPSQRDEALNIYNLCNLHSRNHIKIDVIADSLRDFLGVLHHCNAVIGNEGGAINMGKALNKHSFCIFTPTVKKGAWFVANDEKHMAVHINDYKPQLFKGKKKKEIKNEASSLYKEFRPELFTDKLQEFLKNIL